MVFADSGDTMLDMYMFETNSLLEQLDEILLRTEKSDRFELEDINEIFRIMHTIKGSSAMMSFDSVSHLAHAVEDMFYVIRSNTNANVDKDFLFDLVFQATDGIKAETDKLQQESYVPCDYADLLKRISEYATALKTGTALQPEPPAKEPAPVEQPAPVAESESAPEQSEQSEQSEADAPESGGVEGMTRVRVFFEDEIKMENLRALLLINSIKDYCEHLEFEPADIETNSETAKDIVDNGFLMHFTSYSTVDQVLTSIGSALNVKSYEVIEQPKPSAKPDTPPNPAEAAPPTGAGAPKPAEPQQQAAAAPAAASIEQISNSIAAGRGGAKQNLISVNLTKLDELQDIVGEIVITESMVTSNPDLKGLTLDNFQKSARQLRKLTDELQDIVMSIRMVPLAGVFNKMHRIVRDMSKKLEKDVDLVLVGEDTEVDKSIIDNLADPLMHLIRNSMDHAIEMPDDRAALGKPAKGKITLAAQDTAGEVIISVIDDGKGLDAQKLLAKAKANGILVKPESEYSDKEAFNLILAPGFSTKEQVTEFSGRGVGMDVVKKNIEKLGGSVSVDSIKGTGTTITIKIPLTLAIVDGMEISVGNSVFTIPINTIRESFNIQPDQIVLDPEDSEMIIIRGEIFPIIRAHRIFALETEITDLQEGIAILIEAKDKAACLFADKLIGEQKVVVKPFPSFMSRYNIKQHGIAGCTILGDGSISLILDPHNIIYNY